MNGVFVIIVRSTPGEFENVTITAPFECVVEKNHMIITMSSFSESSLKNVFRPHENKKPTFSNSSGLKSVFEKLGFLDG